MRGRPGALELLDRCADALRKNPAAIGLLWITALPSRLILVKFCLLLFKLGEGAPDYGDLLRRITNAYLCTWFLSLYGRQVFVRATVRTSTSGTAPGREILRVPLSQLGSYLYLAALIELVFWLVLPTAILPLAMIIAAAVAASAAPEDARDLLSPIAAVGRALGESWMLFKLGFIGAIALLLAFLNLNIFSGALVWLAGGIVGLDLPALGAVLSLGNPLFLMLVLAAASLLVEPFWLGMIALQVDAGRSAKSGDDLRRRFAAIARTETL